MMAIVHMVDIEDEKSLLQVWATPALAFIEWYYDYIQFYLNHFACYLSNTSLLQFGNDRIFFLP